MAATITWTGPAGGNWSTPSNWGGVIPVKGDSVFINGTLTGPYTVTLDTSQPAALGTGGEGLDNLTVGNADATLVLSAAGKTLTVVRADNKAVTTLSAGTIDISNTSTLTTDFFDITGGTFLESNGALNVISDKTTGADFSVSGGTFTLSGGAVSVTNEAGFTGGTDAISGGTFNAGTLALSGASTLLTLSGGTATTSTGGGGAIIGSSDSIAISGSAVLDATNGGLADSGTLIGSGTTKGVITGSGTVEASGGTLELATAIAGTGPVFDIGNSGASSLKLDAAPGTGNTFTFLGSAGNLALGGAFKDGVAGLNVSTSTAPTNFVDILGTKGVTVTSGGTGTGAGPASVTLDNGDILNLTGITGGSGGWHVLTAPDSAGTGTDVFLGPVCYVAGTHILTAKGERAIESLSQGDIVLVLSDGELKAQPIKWIGCRRIDLTAHPRPETVAPIRIERDAIAAGIPHRDLLVSPDHAVFVDGKLICARQLLNGTTIRSEFGWTAVDYYHVELDQHAILLAEGLPAESYIDTGNRGFFINSGEPLVLHPDLTDETDYPTREAGSCAPFVSDEASVQPIWQRLADRAATIGRPVPQRATTIDHGLRLLVDQRTVKPVFSDSDRVTFILPRGAREVRLVSRAQSPTAARPWLDDGRRLGVRVKRIVLRGADEVREIPVDHPRITRGWWAVEHDGPIMSRWTDGEAVLPLPAMDGHVMLEVHLAGSMAYLEEAAPEPRTERRAAA